MNLHASLFQEEPPANQELALATTNECLGLGLVIKLDLRDKVKLVITISQLICQSEVARENELERDL